MSNIIDPVVQAAFEKAQPTWNKIKIHRFWNDKAQIYQDDTGWLQEAWIKFQEGYQAAMAAAKVRDFDHKMAIYGYCWEHKVANDSGFMKCQPAKSLVESGYEFTAVYRKIED